jgi:hypothetical protein
LIHPVEPDKEYRGELPMMLVSSDVCAAATGTWKILPNRTKTTKADATIASIDFQYLEISIRFQTFVSIRCTEVNRMSD